MTIFQNINRLVSYAVDTELITEEDIIYTQNRLLELFELDGFPTMTESGTLPTVDTDDLEQILNELTDYAVQHHLCNGDSTVYRDLYDTKIMGCLVPPPSDVINTFHTFYRESSEAATDWFYYFSQNTNYIRRYRIKKDIRWKTKTAYGDMDITINLSKPEKDPKAIAAALNAKQGGYPECLLCKENVGYAGRVNHAARQNHRIIPLSLNGEPWGFQYSPYVYYNEHCIVFNYKHTPMKIGHETFCRLLDFVTQFPHYILGSNADLPIVGGSILTHDHFQGGRYTFPMAVAPLEEQFTFRGFDDVKTGIVRWPLSVIRLTCTSKDKIIALSDKILTKWRNYTDSDSFIFAETDGEPHNTITPIARRRGTSYEMDLVLRNNITTKEHPLGVFHPHAELQHIKKENIGLIEVMGLAVLPARLKTELEQLGQAMLEHRDVRSNPVLEKHADWAEEIQSRYKEINKDTINEILKKETGIVFSHVLEHAGVYKRTEKGKASFLKFIDAVSRS